MYKNGNIDINCKGNYKRKFLEFPLHKDSPKMFVRPYLISAK